jgi:hypothetical protein
MKSPSGPRTPQAKALASSLVSPRHCRGFFLPEQKNVFYQTNPNLLDRTRLTNSFCGRVYEAKPPFSLSRKLTRKKNFFPKRTQIFLVFKDHKSFLWKALRSQACICAIKKTNPNEPNFTARRLDRAQRAERSIETNPDLLGIQGSQILFVQSFTKPSLHFPYQENEPKRTQTHGSRAPFFAPYRRHFDRRAATRPEAEKPIEDNPGRRLVPARRVCNWFAHAVSSCFPEKATIFSVDC